MPQQTRHVASVPSPEARANVQAVLQGNVWRRHDISNGYHWESSGMGWSSLLCTGEDSNGCGCVGKRSNRHLRCLSNGMNERKREGTVEILRSRRTLRRRKPGYKTTVEMCGDAA